MRKSGKPGSSDSVNIHRRKDVSDSLVNPIVMARPAQGIAEEEFDLIVRTHQQRIYRVLRSLLRDEDAAANLTQDCFVRAFEARKSFRGDASISTWLTRIAVNLARDHMRNRRAGFWKRIFASHRTEEDAAEEAVQVPDERATAERILIAREQAASVWKIVDTLSPRQREIFVLRFGEEMSLQDIGDTLGMEVGTVKAHLSRAVATVRSKVREQQ